MSDKTKIDWCDSTINPVVGCKRGCAYCYARRIFSRFNDPAKWAIPSLNENVISKPLKNKTPKSVFIDSMSDPEYWTEEQTAKVMDWMKKSNFNYFILLTKSPKTINAIRSRKDARILFDQFKQKLFLGYSCGDLKLLRKAWEECPAGTYDGILDCESSDPIPFEPDFLSIEPLEEDITIPLPQSFKDLMAKIQSTIKVVIIGAETGNRLDKVACKKEWVERLIECSQCTRNLEKNCAIFMKESLRGIMGNDFRQDILPWPCAKQSPEKPFCSDYMEFTDEHCWGCPYNCAGGCFGYQYSHEEEETDGDSE